MGKKGLCDNIHAKRKRGESPAKPGDKGYPKTLNIMKDGGKLKGKLDGPSHKKGGIKFNLGGEIQEAEGGEYVIKKDSVESLEKNPNTQGVLDYINKNGRLPQGNNYEYGGLIKDARKRRK